MSTSKKRGQLGLDEEQFIKDNVNNLTIPEIAEALNRTEAPIRRFITENALLVTEESRREAERLRLMLHSKTFWPEIVKQFDEENGELALFENTWIGLVKQFKDDVLPAEELQIKQYITLEILLNRCMEDRRRHIRETDRLQRAVNEEYDKPLEERDLPRLANLETQLGYARNALANYTNEWTKLSKEAQNISKDLKATREQRIKRIEDGKSSWPGLIKMLEDDEIRQREGREAELYRLAVEKVKQDKLYPYHTFADGILDRPILSSESVNHKEKE
jgi:hypothetical protein